MTPRHHTVPQVYLRFFADDARRVRLVARDDLAASQVTSVRNACAEVGFYRVDPEAFEVPPGHTPPEPEVIEAYLGGFEARAAPSLCKLNHTGMADITQDDWYHLIHFIALQTARGNRFREDLDAAANQAMRTYLGQCATDDRIRAWLEQRGDPSDPPAVAVFRESLLGDARPRLLPPQEFYVQESMRFALTTLSDLLASGRRWSVIESRVAAFQRDQPG